MFLGGWKPHADLLKPPYMFKINHNRKITVIMAFLCSGYYFPTLVKISSPPTFQPKKYHFSKSIKKMMAFRKSIYNFYNKIMAFRELKCDLHPKRK